MKKGKYIVIEGGDGVGKTTQLNLLLEWLQEQGVNCIWIEEPGGTPMAEAIRTILKDRTIERHPETDALLFTAARSDLRGVFAKLDTGAWVISSRSYLTTIAFQGYGDGIDVDKIKATTKMWMPDGYTTPDVEIIMSFDAKASRERLQKRDLAAMQADTFESKDLSFHDRAQQAYVKLGQEDGRYLVDADRSIEEIQKEIREIVQPVLDDWQKSA